MPRDFVLDFDRGVRAFLAPIRQEELDLTHAEPEFLGLAAATLGDAATDRDGTGALLEEAASAFSSGRPALERLDLALADDIRIARDAVADTLAEDTALLALDLAKAGALIGVVDEQTAEHPAKVAGAQVAIQNKFRDSRAAALQRLRGTEVELD